MANGFGTPGVGEADPAAPAVLAAGPPFAHPAITRGRTIASVINAVGPSMTPIVPRHGSEVEAELQVPRYSSAGSGQPTNACGTNRGRRGRHRDRSLRSVRSGVGKLASWRPRTASYADARPGSLGGPQYEVRACTVTGSLGVR